MKYWLLTCKTCNVQVSLAERVTNSKQAQWELNYHRSCYRGHEAHVTAPPKPKQRRKQANGEREWKEETGTEVPTR